MPDQSFFEQVYEIVKLIPKGRVTTYGAIASALGTKSSSRMVGWAMNASHGDPSVPAHRVVNRNGYLTGKNHFGNPDEMQQLLNEENIIVENDKILDFARLFWNPTTELTKVDYDDLRVRPNLNDR